MLARRVVDGHVQKMRVLRLGGREVAQLTVRVPGETRHVVVAEGLGVGLLGPEARAKLREAMAGAVVPREAAARELAEKAARGLERLERLEGPEGTAGRQGLEGQERDAREALEAEGARIVDEVARGAVEGRRDALRRALAKATARVARRADAVKGDLARAEGADAMARRAQLFVAEAGRAPRGATRLATVDWSSGEAVEVEIPLDPARGAREQIDAMFQRARRLKEGARIGRARLADAEKALAALAAIASELPTALPDALSSLAARARAAAPRDFSLPSASPLPAPAHSHAPTPARAPAHSLAPVHAPAPAPGARPRPRARPSSLQPPLPPYRLFLSLPPSGARLLVGRGADKNDALTFHVARPHDLWLHAKNRAGAHVIVPLDKNASCPADVLVDAAHLAAHFSEARDEAVVEVQYTPRRYLRKPRGSAAGFVVVDREKVLVLRREEARLRALLEREGLEPGGGGGDGAGSGGGGGGGGG